jgi:hypothetical protein
MDAIHLQPGAAAGSAARKAGALAGRHDLPARTVLPGRLGQGPRRPDHQQQTECTDRHQEFAAHRHDSRLNEVRVTKIISAGRERFQIAGGRLL